MQKDWHDVDRQKLSSIALVAPTGAGKTVICAAIAEGLFYGLSLGKDSVKEDKNAVILWLSDSPPLNEQTKKRFDKSSDKLKDDMIIIDPDYAKSHNELERHKIYFLNRQKLSSEAKLSKAAEGGRSFWDVLKNTIESPDLNLYVFIDEAHRGLGSGDNAGISDKLNHTIYDKLINGQPGLNPPMPVIIGISATITRWNEYMDKGKERRTPEPNVVISNEEVRKAGIIKRFIELRSPEIFANVKDQDLFMSCKKLDEFTEHWKYYHDRYEEELVEPLMVVQVENNITNDALYDLCMIIHQALPKLDITTAFANVFGEHEDRGENGVNIPYISPDLVQDTPSVKVLFAKDAISTGWDCPRAEVLYSRRKRQDKTYIHQMLGRMVRTPLAHKINSDDFLNSVVCYLPEYDTNSVDEIVDLIKKDGELVSDIKKGDTDAVPTQETKEFLDKFMKAPEETIEEEPIQSSEDSFLQPQSHETSSSLFTFNETGNLTIVPENNSGTSNGDVEKVKTEQGQLFTPRRRSKKSVALDYQRKTGKLPNGLKMRYTQDSGKKGNNFTNASEKDIEIVVDKKQLDETLSNFTTSTLAEDEEIKKSFCEIYTCPVENTEKGVFARFFSIVNFLVGVRDPEGNCWEDDEEIKESFYNAVESSINDEAINKKEFEEALYNLKNREQIVTRINPLTGEKYKERIKEFVKVVQLGLFNRENNELLKSCVNAFNSDYAKFYIVAASQRFNIGNDESCQRLAAVVSSPHIMNFMEDWAERKIKNFITVHNVNKGRLSDEEREKWEQIVSGGQKFAERKMVFPEGSSTMDTRKKAYKKHITSSNSTGKAYFALNDIEDAIVENEINNKYNLAWYRNPNSGNSSLSIPCKIGNGKYKNFHPDFIFFERNNEGKIIRNIIDPHGDWIGDSISRLRGYIEYLNRHGNDFAKVIVVTDVGGKKYRYLDLKNDEVIKEIESFEGTNARNLFEGPLSCEYVKG